MNQELAVQKELIVFLIAVLSKMVSRILLEVRIKMSHVIFVMMATVLYNANLKIVMAMNLKVLVLVLHNVIVLMECV